GARSAFQRSQNRPDGIGGGQADNLSAQAYLKGNLLIQNNEQSTLRRDLARSGISVTDPTTRTPAMNEGPTSAFDELLPPPPAAKALNVSLSWLAKARLRGDGPRYVKIGRSVR